MVLPRFQTSFKRLKGGGIDIGKARVQRVFPDVEVVRVWHQIARYLYSGLMIEQGLSCTEENRKRCTR